MDKFKYVAHALLGALVLYQLFVCVVICRASEYDRTQKLLQLFVVWLVPLFGAIGCHLILRNQREPSVDRQDYRFVPQDPNGEP